MCDREGDIFELLAEPLREGSHLLIRAAQDRRVKTEEEMDKLFSKLLDFGQKTTVSVNFTLNISPELK